MNTATLDSPDIKVSVAMITYNHEPFIAQAIESVLMQQTDFAFELVIGEDCSTDATRNLVRSYAAKYPNKINALLHSKNLGPAHSPGKNNFVSVLKSCRGKYIALLEGDDYWTDPHKLQKQVNFLDRESDFAVCFHNAKIIYENNAQEPQNYCPATHKKEFSLEDLLGENFIPTCSVVYRNGLIEKFPEWFYKTVMADWPLHILNAQMGRIGYIENTMGVYRIHSGGIWSGENEMQKFRHTLALYKVFQTHLSIQYQPIIRKQIIRLWDATAAALVKINIDNSFQQSTLNIKEEIELWVDGVTLTKLEKGYMLAKAYAGLGFKHFHRDNYRLANRFFRHAIWHDLSWAKNKGALSVLLKTTTYQLLRRNSHHARC